jgi:hypothetical protein
MGLSGAIGDAWEILANVVGKRGYPGSCALKAADPGWARRDNGARYWWCCASGRAGLGTGGVAASGRAVLGTGGVAAVSPVVTTVAGEVTADVLMTSL